MDHSEGSPGQGEDKVTLEDLALIEDELQEKEVEILRYQWRLCKDIYDARAKVIGQIPGFWYKVIQGAPSALDEYFSYEDQKVLEESILSIEVSRFEVDQDPENGDPRSFAIKFKFSPNSHIEDETLEKRFSFRVARDGWRGYCSEPVKVHWKANKDLTDGLTDAAIKGWEAWQRKLATEPDAKQDSVPEYKEVASKIESAKNESFFRFFGYISSRQFVTREESTEAMAAEKSRMEERKKTGKYHKGAEEESMDDYLQSAEIMAEADDIASTIADDLYPNAIKYYTITEELNDMTLSEGEYEDDDMDEDDDEEDDEDQPQDIRKIVRDLASAKQPPNKKRKT